MSRKLRFLPFLLAPLFAAPLAAHAAPTYTVSTLANLATNASPQGMNASGQVVGYTSNGKAYVAGTANSTDLHPAGATSSSAFGINDAGVAAGQIERSDGVYRAVTFSGGTVNDLGSLGNATTNSFGWGINNSGQVSGTSYLTNDNYHAVLYTAGSGMADLGALGGANSIGYGLNDNGAVTGYAEVDSAGNYHAFSTAGGTMSDLGTLGGTLSQGWAINNAGAVAGASFLTAGDSTTHAFMYANGIMVDLGTLGGANSYAYDINSAGQVVGGSEHLANSIYSQFAFLYSGGTMVDLNSLIDPSLGWTLTFAAAINDNGQIAVEGCQAGRCKALRLDLINPGPGPSSPVPEPEPYTALVAAVGLAGFLGRRRKSGAAVFHLGR